MFNTFIKIFSLIFFVAFSVNATTYYVTTNGNNSNNGLSESTAWKTIKYAVEKATTPGDIVYVKAGLYDGERVVFNASGTSGNPITIEGYKNAPGDITNTDWWQYGNELSATQMPLLDGGNRASGTAFQIYSVNYVVIRNFQITNYNVGIGYYEVNNNIAENIIAKNFGDVTGSYNGKGISLAHSNNSTLKNCVVVNSGAEGINLLGNGNRLEKCKVYCNEGYTGQADVNAATDYYIVLYGDNNVLKDCYIERVGNLDHGGHGIGIKGNGENNLFENCTAKNLKNGGFYVRHRGVKNNTFNHCTAIGGESGDGFIVRDGASHNVFNYCKTDGCFLAVGFYDTDEDGINNAGMYNTFTNSIFENTQHACIAFAGQNKESKAEYNNFVNCVFYKGVNLFNTGRKNENNEMINCIVSNIDNYMYTKYTNYREIHFKFTNTDFWNMGFNIPFDTKSTYTDILKVNPLFEDAENGNYRLKENSQCIDAGLADMSAYPLPELDYYGNPRFFDSKDTGTAIIDMGIYEVPTFTDVEENIVVPNSFTVFQNYPNPFNPTTNISYYLDKSTNVKILVYNSLGQLVNVLLDKFQSSGNHSIIWHATNVSSGTYFYKVSAGRAFYVKRCILLK